VIDHDRALELAASAIDFGLSPAEDAELTEHLASCAACRSTVAALSGDAAAIAALDHEDAPAELRERIRAAVPPAADADAGSAASSRQGRTIRFPTRYQRPALLAAAAAVTVAIVGLTLPWLTATPAGAPGIGVIDPSGRPVATGSPGASPGPGGPSSAPGEDLVTNHEQLAQLTADSESGGVVEPGTSFHLSALGGRSASELAARLTVQPTIELSTTVEPDGRVRLTPAEPLEPGVVYRFAIAEPDGKVIDSWAFQARQPLRVVSTLPVDTSTEVPLDSGIEVTFDQDGIVGAAEHMTIEPRLEGRFEQHGRVLTFVPERLAPATIYTVTVSPGVIVEPTGEVLETTTRFRFETAASNEAGPPDSFFHFSNDLFESATADPPVIGLWWYSNTDEQEVPREVRLEVYRFADRQSAIDAFHALRDVPRWSQFHRAETVPTGGLQHVARIDAALRDDSGTLWATLPEALPAGWYLVEHPSDEEPAQAIVQVTDLSAYLMVSGTRSLIWANDLAAGRAVGGASVAVDGTAIGQTDTNGLLVADTPGSLLPRDERECTSACTPMFTVTSGAASAFLPGTGSANPDGIEVGGYEDYGYFGSSGDTNHWLVFDTDRTLYRRTDTVNAWGLVRDRDSGSVPDAVTLRLVGEGDGPSVPVATTRATLRPTGAFAGSLGLRDLPEGEYRLELVVGNEVATSRYVRVDRILKPAYRIDVTTGRRVYIAGDRIRITASAAFYEGTPVPGVPLAVQGEIERAITTDSTGSAIVRTTARWPSDEPRDGPQIRSIEVRPRRAEEGEIRGASREFVVYPSSWIVTGDAVLRGGRVRISGTANELARDRIEREIGAGRYPWDVDPRGTGLARRAVSARVIEEIPIRTQVGTSYDFVEKRVVPLYEYDQRDRLVGTLRLRTDARGRFSGSVAAPDQRHSYRVELSIADPDGLRSTVTAWATQALDVQPAESAAHLARIGLTDPGDDPPLHVGEALRLAMHEPGVVGVRDDPHLFITAQAGIRDAVVASSDRFQTTFPAWGPPNVEYMAVRFTGRGYRQGASYTASFDTSEREMTVRLSTDKARYAPGERVRLSVRTLGPDGRPISASVVLRAVDEKLFTIGGVEADDPLGQLYAHLPSGVLATYATHRGPTPRPEGGDTTGGGGDEDERDAILFRAVDTDRNGRGSVTFDLPSDLTSWRVSATGFGAGLEAGRSSLQVPVGSPFFVDAAFAPEYLVTDRPSIQIRGYGSALTAGSRVRFTVDAKSLGLHRTGLSARAFQAVTVALPRLTQGTHRITITARTGSGASARRHTLTRSFDVVASRLTRTTTTYREVTGQTAAPGGGGLTELTVSDAGIGPALASLVDLAASGSSRVESAVAADVASEILAQRSDEDPAAATAFDGATYQRADGGVAILPYAASDLEVSALVALVAPERFSGVSLRSYLNGVLDGRDETRERRNLALAGLAGLADPVVPRVRAALADDAITVRERTMLAIGAARLGDVTTARASAATLAGRHGQAIGAEARLQVGDDNLDSTTATALMAMLLAAADDPLAGRYWAYVATNPTELATFDLHELAVARWTVDDPTLTQATVAYVVAGERHVVELAPGDVFSIRLTRAQRASFAIEPIVGRIGMTATWREPVRIADIEREPDVTITRSVQPRGAIAAGDLVVVDLTVRFGPRAPSGCHSVVDLVPSGLTPVGLLRGWVDPETDEPSTGRVYPDSQVAQRVVFCAEATPKVRTQRLRYVARVITVGTYRWEPAVVESRTDPDRAALVPRTNVRIR
jgi:hypothetical protein